MEDDDCFFEDVLDPFCCVCAEGFPSVAMFDSCMASVVEATSCFEFDSFMASVVEVTSCFELLLDAESFFSVETLLF